MPYINIILLEDIPEKGRHWKKNEIIYDNDQEMVQKYIDEGKASVWSEDEPIWKKWKKEDDPSAGSGTEEE